MYTWRKHQDAMSYSRHKLSKSDGFTSLAHSRIRLKLHGREALPLGTGPEEIFLLREHP